MDKWFVKSGDQRNDGDTISIIALIEIDPLRRI